MDLDDIEYTRLPDEFSMTGLSRMGGFEIRNKATGSNFNPSISYRDPTIEIYGFRIVLPEAGQILRGSYGEEFQHNLKFHELPTDFPQEFTDRMFGGPEQGWWSCNYHTVTDFLILEGPDPALLSAADSESVIAEIMFHFTALPMVHNDYQAKKHQRNNPEGYALKMRRQMEPGYVEPVRNAMIIDFQPANCANLFARFINRKDGSYVRFR